MINKWTIGLAAAGVVSLGLTVSAEEKAASVMTALSSTTLSGYVDTSAQWNFGTGNARLPDYKFGGSSKADGFNLDVVQIRIEKPLDEAEWAAGYRVDLWAGPDANILGTQSFFNSGGKALAGDFAIRQAYIALRAPFQNGLDFKVGVFDSIIGYESVESGNNPNYTRSFGHSIEPQTHTGVLASYRFNDLISASVGVADTIGPAINERAGTESKKTYMASVALTAPENLGFISGSTLYAGFVQGFSGSYLENQSSYYVGSTIATPVAGLRCGASLDVLNVHHLDGETWSVAGYASYQATEKLSLHMRGEYLRDRGEQKFFAFFDPNTGDLVPTNPDRVLALTATAQYDLWKNVISRLELRWDHSLSGQETWGGSVDGEPSRRNEWMLAANVIYKF
jgi:putative OmpL-like beta-barrel porin-2